MKIVADIAADTKAAAEADTEADTVASNGAGSATGTIIERLYVLHERLGEGGMGTVYRATQRLSGQDVALKLVYGGIVRQASDTLDADDPPATRHSVETSQTIHLRLALEREFEVLASLHHPHIVRVLDYGFGKYCGPYLVMELLPAARSLLEAGREASYETKAEWIGQLLRALAYLHRRGVVHRDIKPSNVLCVDGQVKVVDFGIALHGESASGIAGTLEYMAPELLLGEAPSVSSDLYAVGVLACQLFTGHLPYQRTSRMTQMLDEILGTSAALTVSEDVAAYLEANRGSPSNPGVADTGLALLDDLDASLKAVLVRLLAREPAARYPDALSVLRDLGTATGLPLVQETSETRESFLQAASLVGRDHEVEVLTDAFRKARSGQGGLWLLGGESGVGKSRLVDELRTLAMVRGAMVLRGQAIREGGGPYHVLCEVLERIYLDVSPDDQALSILLPILPRLAGLLRRPIAELPAIDSQTMQERARDTIVSIIEAGSGDSGHPLVLILEDLHWAGKESLVVLANLANLALQRALLILGTYRDDEAPDLPEAIPGANLLKLSRLDNTSIAVLCESMLGTAGRSAELIGFLHRESEGNPLFIVEIMRALAEDAGNLSAVTQQQLPEHILTGGVRAILNRRISHIPQWAHSLLELAAVAGRQLDLPMLSHSAYAAAMNGHSLDTWLMHCASMSLLELRDQRWRFTHDKLRECILGRLQADARLAALHYEAAGAIERAYLGAQRDEHIVKLAYHYLEAGSLVPPDKLCLTALRAAEREMQQLSFDEAASLLEQIQTGTEAVALDAELRYELWLTLGQAHIRAGNHERGKKDCERAAELARQIGDSLLLARAAVTYGSEFSASSRDPNLTRLLEEALLRLAECDHPLRARVMARLAASLQPAPDFEQPVAMAREAVAMARRLGDPEVLRQTLIPACAALVTFGPPHERLALDRESVELCKRAQDRVQAQRGYLRLVFDYAELGDMAKMDASIHSYEEGAREFRQPQYQWPALMLRAMRALMKGRFAESDQITEEVRKIGERHRDFNAVFTTILHRLSRFFISERYEDLIESESNVRPSLTRIFSRQLFVQQAMTVWVQARAGQLTQVRELLAELRNCQRFLQSQWFLPFVAEACYLTSDVALAELAYERLLPFRASFWPAHYPVSMTFFPPYTQPLGLLAMTLGRWDEATEHLQDALARCESIALYAHIARLRCEYAMALLGRGGADDGARARQLLWQARKLAMELAQDGLLPLIDAQEGIAAARGVAAPE